METGIKLLKWDSKFFGIKIGKIDYDFLPENSNIEKLIDKSDFDLIYCFIDPVNQEQCCKINKLGAKLIDKKVDFKKELTDCANINTNIHSFSNTKIPVELYQLAQESGKYSRFKLDHNFKKGSFKQLYNTWLENSINKKFADETFVYKEGDTINGFITLKIGAGVGTIGLIGVDEIFRGKNIGTKLIEHCEYTLIQNNIYQLRVATQKANKQAMRFYKKNQYSIKQKVNIYHLWL